MSTDFLRKIPENSYVFTARAQKTARTEPDGLAEGRLRYFISNSITTEADTDTSPLTMAVRLAPVSLAS